MMIGNAWLPDHHRVDGRSCPGRAGYLRAIPGEFVRTCECGATYIAVIAVTDYISSRCGRETLAVRWLTVDREPVT